MSGATWALAGALQVLGGVPEKSPGDARRAEAPCLGTCPANQSSERCKRNPLSPRQARGPPVTAAGQSGSCATPQPQLLTEKVGWDNKANVPTG